MYPRARAIPRAPCSARFINERGRPPRARAPAAGATKFPATDPSGEAPAAARRRRAPHRPGDRRRGPCNRHHLFHQVSEWVLGILLWWFTAGHAQLQRLLVVLERHAPRRILQSQLRIELHRLAPVRLELPVHLALLFPRRHLELVLGWLGTLTSAVVLVLLADGKHGARNLFPQAHFNRGCSDPLTVP